MWVDDEEKKTAAAKPSFNNNNNTSICKVHNVSNILNLRRRQSLGEEDGGSEV